MFLVIAPEIFIVSSILGLVVLEIIFKNKKVLFLFFLCSFVSVFIACLILLYNLYKNKVLELILLGGRFSLNAEIIIIKILILVVCLFLVSISFEGFKYGNEKGYGEFCALILSTSLGALLLVSSSDILTFYVSLETATIPLFLLVAWKERSWSAEAAIKYTLLGMLSSVFLLLGISYIYGMTGSTDFYSISYFLFNNSAVYFISIIFIVSIGFKMAIVPFHMWISDVYYGSSFEIAAYLSVFSKIIGIVLIWNIFYKMLGNHIIYESIFFISILSSFTMTFGNILAIGQSNIKRIMAFSSISQAGYLLIGLLDGGKMGVTSLFYYMLVYSVSNLAAFTVFIYYKKVFNVENVQDFNGLAEKAPVMSLILTIALFSLAGIPPLSGFIGKFFIFNIAAQENVNWLVLMAAVNSTISLYYYLGIIKRIYIYDFEKKLNVDTSKFLIIKSNAILLGVLILLVGLYSSFYNTIYTIINIY